MLPHPAVEEAAQPIAEDRVRWVGRVPPGHRSGYRAPGESRALPERPQGGAKAVAKLTQRACPRCGGSLRRAPGPGRPPRYCGGACKRAVELEVRRLRRAEAAVDAEVAPLRACRGSSIYRDLRTLDGRSIQDLVAEREHPLWTMREREEALRQGRPVEPREFGPVAVKFRRRRGDRLSPDAKESGAPERTSAR